MRERVGVMLCVGLVGAAVFGAMTLSVSQVQADDPNSAPNPYHVVEHWAKLPEGRAWGQAIGVDIDRDGTSLWVFDRCGGKTCDGSNVAPIQKFDATGKQVASFGARPVQLAPRPGRGSRRQRSGSPTARRNRGDGDAIHPPTENC